MKPKIYRGMPFDEYRQLPGVNKSLLFPGLRSMAHLKAKMDAPPEDTEALAIGSAFHCLTTEPDTFSDMFAVGGPINPKTGRVYGYDTKAFAEWAEQQGKPVLTTEQYQAVVAMAASVREHPRAAAILACPGDVELAIQWTDAETGVLCKCRLDYFVCDQDPPAIADLKSCQDARPKAFSRSVLDYGYHIQAAMYSDAVFAAFGKMPVFLFICCEKEPPYAVQVYHLSDRAIIKGRQQYRSLLAAYKRASETGTWAAYSPEIVEIDLPEWAVGEEVAA